MQIRDGPKENCREKSDHERRTCTWKKTGRKDGWRVRWLLLCAALRSCRRELLQYPPLRWEAFPHRARRRSRYRQKHRQKRRRRKARKNWSRKPLLIRNLRLRLPKGKPLISRMILQDWNSLKETMWNWKKQQWKTGLYLIITMRGPINAYILLRPHPGKPIWLPETLRWHQGKQKQTDPMAVRNRKAAMTNRRQTPSSRP